MQKAWTQGPYKPHSGAISGLCLVIAGINATVVYAVLVKFLNLSLLNWLANYSQGGHPVIDRESSE